MSDDVRIIPLSESAVVVEFGRTICIELNQKAIALTKALNSKPFPGMIEAAPAYSSTSVFFDIGTVRKKAPNVEPMDFVARSILASLNDLEIEDDTETPTVEIPFRVDDGEYDLADVSANCGLSHQQVIEAFTSVEYRIYMLGFLPGFPYMGTLDDRLVLPRRDVPRERVPSGSVAIAGKQVGIYPQDSPGGWHILGRTKVPMFDADNIALLRPGMKVRFVAEQ